MAGGIALVHILKILKTRVIRMSMMYAIVSACLMGVGLVATYFWSDHFIKREITDSLSLELDGLKASFENNELEEHENSGTTYHQDFASSRTMYRLENPNGEKIKGNILIWPPDLLTNEQVVRVELDEDQIQGSLHDIDGKWPAIATELNNGSRLMIVYNMTQLDKFQEFIFGALVTVMSLISALFVLMGFNLGSKILAKVDSINRTTDQILNGNLSDRLSVDTKPDEFDDISLHINRLLDHNQKLIEGMRQVTDNIAHDLRRPLSRIRNKIDIELMDSDSPALEEVGADISGVIDTFNALLGIAQIEAGHFRGSMDQIDLSAIITDVCEIYDDLFNSSSCRFQWKIEDNLKIVGNRQLVGEMLSNLIENAHKYGGNNSQIHLALTQNNNTIALSITDDGPGIPAEKYEYVLERFSRLDKARSSEGNGLGLSLVKAVVELHHGKLNLFNNHPGLGILIEFPDSRSITKHIHKSGDKAD